MPDGVIFCIGASAGIAGGAPASSQGSVSAVEPCAGHHEVSILTIGGVAFGRLIDLGALGLFGGRWHGEQLAGFGNAGGAMAVGK